MCNQDLMGELVQTLKEKGAPEDLAVAIVSILQTEENFQKMLDTLLQIENPSRTRLLGEAILIADSQ